jgi:hypothetical protein
MFALAVTGCSGVDEVRSAGELSAALSEAAAGDTVRLGIGTFQGSFEVPRGVALVGAGRDATTLLSTTDIALRVDTAPGTSPSSVSELTVIGGRGGIVLRGGGRAHLAAVGVHVDLGTAISAIDLEELHLRDVDVRGSITAENADVAPVPATVETTSAHGIAVIGGGVHIDRVTVEGFALLGAAFVECDLDAKDLRIERNLGTGLLLAGGEAAIERSLTGRGLQGTQLPPAYNAVFAYGAIVHSQDLEVIEGGGWGVLLDDTSGTHHALRASGNHFAGMFVQNSRDVRVSGELMDNGVAGLVAVAVEELALEDLRAGGNRLEVAGLGGTTAATGDGLQLAGPGGSISVARAELVDNERAGLLVDLGGRSTEVLSLESIRVDAEEAALGVVVQSGDIREGWDEGVVRAGTAATNDSAFLRDGTPLAVLKRLELGEAPARNGSWIGIDTPME